MAMWQATYEAAGQTHKKARGPCPAYIRVLKSQLFVYIFDKIIAVCLQFGAGHG